MKWNYAEFHLCKAPRVEDNKGIHITFDLEAKYDWEWLFQICSPSVSTACYKRTKIIVFSLNHTIKLVLLHSLIYLLTSHICYCKIKNVWIIIFLCYFCIMHSDLPKLHFLINLNNFMSDKVIKYIHGTTHHYWVYKLCDNKE